MKRSFTKLYSILVINIKENNIKEINTVNVRWHDGYLETFEATEVRFGCNLLWMRLVNGQNRQIPLRSVRWFGMSLESHSVVGEETIFTINVG